MRFGSRCNAARRTARCACLLFGRRGWERVIISKPSRDSRKGQAYPTNYWKKQLTICLLFRYRDAAIEVTILLCRVRGRVES